MFAKGNAVSLRKQNVCSGTTVFGNGTLYSVESFLQESCPGDVVRMAVGVHCNKRKGKQSSQTLNIVNFAMN